MMASMCAHYQFPFVFSLEVGGSLNFIRRSLKASA